MLDFLRRRSSCGGSALFRGTVPHGLEQLDGLTARGVTAEAGPANSEAHWTATLRHPEWGEAQAACLRNPPRPDRSLLSIDPRLAGADAEAIGDCGVSVSLQMEGPRRFVLRDRKYMLRFLEALLGADGVVAVDHTSQAFWTRPALEDELAHDADLDVESVFTIHAVSEDEDDRAVTWLHTHGLAELGRFDFDIVRPDREFVDNCGDFCRALAFAILEGTAVPGMTDFEIGRPFPELFLAPAGDFMRAAAPDDTAPRDDPSLDHLRDRVVLCDPPPGNPLTRLIRGDRPRPGRAFRRGLPENVVLSFSTAATELMADRARRTFPVLRCIADEVAPLELPVLLKIGYVVDGGGPDQREHLWFHVHALGDETVDATLLNAPHAIARMNEGDRGTHAIEGLSDWVVLTPLGQINPRAFHVRRMIGDLRDDLLRAKTAEEAGEKRSP